MSDVQIPTCGRVVHYYPNGADAHCNCNHAEVVPAIVVQAFSTSLNLSVFPMNPDGTNVLRYSVQHMSSVPLDENGDPKKGIAFWAWPYGVA